MEEDPTASELIRLVQKQAKLLTQAKGQRRGALIGTLLTVFWLVFLGICWDAWSSSNEFALSLTFILLLMLTVYAAIESRKRHALEARIDAIVALLSDEKFMGDADYRDLAKKMCGDKEA